MSVTLTETSTNFPEVPRRKVEFSAEVRSAPKFDGDQETVASWARTLDTVQTTEIKPGFAEYQPPPKSAEKRKALPSLWQPSINWQALREEEKEGATQKVEELQRKLKASEASRIAQFNALADCLDSGYSPEKDQETSSGFSSISPCLWKPTSTQAEQIQSLKLALEEQKKRADDLSAALQETLRRVSENKQDTTDALTSSGDKTIMDTDLSDTTPNKSAAIRALIDAMSTTRSAGLARVGELEKMARFFKLQLGMVSGVMEKKINSTATLLILSTMRQITTAKVTDEEGQEMFRVQGGNEMLEVPWAAVSQLASQIGIDVPLGANCMPPAIDALETCRVPGGWVEYGKQGTELAESGQDVNDEEGLEEQTDSFSDFGGTILGCARSAISRFSIFRTADA